MNPQCNSCGGFDHINTCEHCHALICDRCRSPHESVCTVTSRWRETNAGATVRRIDEGGEKDFFKGASALSVGLMASVPRETLEQIYAVSPTPPIDGPVTIPIMTPGLLPGSEPTITEVPVEVEPMVVMASITAPADEHVPTDEAAPATEPATDTTEEAK